MDKVKFKVNGVEYYVGSEVSSTTTLLGYLRHKLELRGTKYMCLEGGCGSCIVSVVKTPGDAPLSINSCLVPITSCQDWDITTIEEIGNRLKGYHPIQEVLAQNHGSQCGYCSPGWVMAFYSLLQSKTPTMLEIEQSFGGNVCRCTGYRPILEAFKKFASDVPDSDILDIEDLKICNQNKETCKKKKCSDSDWCFVSKSDVLTKTSHIELFDKRDWYKVQTLTDIFRIWRDNSTEPYMLVAGNTGKGVYPILEYPKILIDITGVSDLKGFYIDQNLVIGAGNTFTEVINIFDTVANKEYFNYVSILKEHLTQVAHIPVRNTATLAGNLMLKNEHSDFKSDIFLLLQTVGAELNVMVALGITKRLTMEQFLKENMRRKVIISIVLPPLSDAHKLVTYKIMPRSQNAHAIIHAGFSYKLNDSNTVVTCRIVFDGLSNKFNKATKTEQYLIGKKLFNNETLQGALKELDNELIVTENLPNPPADHRRKMALGLFYKGLLYLCPSSILKPQYKSGAIKLKKTRPVSKAQQVFDTNPSIWPLNQPIPKIEALIQCAGEAAYTEDLPKLPNEVYAAFVLSTVALGTIEKIDPSKALKESGVLAFYSALDIPGVNSFTPTPVSMFLTANEEVVASNKVEYYNQPLGIIVATCQDIANKAATLVDVKYSEVRNPVTDIRITKNNPNKVTLLYTNDATVTGKDIDKVIKGESTIFGQYHFCIETLVSVTHPTEEGLKIYATAQWMDCIQQAVSRMLKIPQNRIDVYVRRLGGAYGMKISRISQVAAACSLVSYKLNRPCRFIQTLTNNMRVVGKRLPCSINFEIGVNNKGVLQYVKQDLYSDSGYIFNEPLIMLGVDVYNNCYRKEMWSYKAYNAITDTPSNTWCRSPGSLENIAMAEMLIERISYELSLDPLEVRLANLDTENYQDMIEILETIKRNSQYEERKNAVELFNRENMWKKRGLRFSFLRWTPVGGQYLDIILSVFNDDGSVAISHGGIEMGQGINTRATQVCAYLLNIPIEKVQIKATDTLLSPNGLPTGGSITSQNITVAVRKCCVELLNRLKPIKEQMNNPTWEQLIKKAYDMKINLQVQGFVNLEDVISYNIYGITLAEVEIDVLTGEWQMIRVDLIEDCGRSVNPKIDIGQIEGAFTMGVGYFTTEQLVVDPKTGELLTNRTWDYWVPQALDIPQDFRIYLRKRSYSSDLIFGSKATGEPATCMGIVVSFALRHAITAARMDSDISPTEWFQIDGPFTVDKICYSSASLIKNFKFY